MTAHEYHATYCPCGGASNADVQAVLDRMATPDYSHRVWTCPACGGFCEATYITGTEPDVTCRCGQRLDPKAGA